jgi:hypothetical protein
MLRVTERSDSQHCLSSWYTEKDYNSFKQDCRNTIAMGAGVDQTEYSEISEDFCFRGLEVLGACQDRVILRLERRRQAQDAVWNAQDAIWNALDSGEISDENIAESVRRVSQSSQMDAHLQALQYSRENKREELMSSISGLGRRKKSAVCSVGGSMRNLGKKTLSIRNLGKKDSMRNLLVKKDSMRNLGRNSPPRKQGSVRNLLGKKDSMRNVFGKKDSTRNLSPPRKQASMRNVFGKKDSTRNLFGKKDSTRNLSPPRKQASMRNLLGKKDTSQAA